MPVQISGNSVATEEDLEELESIIDRLERQVEQVAGAGTQGLARDVESLRSEVDVLMARVSKLQNSVNERKKLLALYCASSAFSTTIVLCVTSAATAPRAASCGTRNAADLPSGYFNSKTAPTITASRTSNNVTPTSPQRARLGLDAANP